MDKRRSSLLEIFGWSQAPFNFQQVLQETHALSKHNEEAWRMVANTFKISYLVSEKWSETLLNIRIISHNRENPTALGLNQIWQTNVAAQRSSRLLSVSTWSVRRARFDTWSSCESHSKHQHVMALMRPCAVFTIRHYALVLRSVVVSLRDQKSDNDGAQSRLVWAGVTTELVRRQRRDLTPWNSAGKAETFVFVALTLPNKDTERASGSNQGHARKQTTTGNA